MLLTSRESGLNVPNPASLVNEQLNILENTCFLTAFDHFHVCLLKIKTALMWKLLASSSSNKISQGALVLLSDGVYEGKKRQYARLFFNGRS